jgi:Uma2 family endonuclease
MTRVSMAIDSEQVRVPGWVNNLESFRRWTDDDDFPESGRISFLDGEVRVDLSREQLYSHNDVKAELTFVFRGLAKREVPGRFYGGVYISNEKVNVSHRPDGCFVLNETLSSDRIRIVEGRQSGFVEIEGIPDLLIEIVSDSSVQKDTVILRDRYALAGVPEYWLIDARKPPLRFEIFRLTTKGYGPARKLRGWNYSAILGRWFRLSESVAGDGFPTYSLEHSEAKPAK